MVGMKHVVNNMEHRKEFVTGNLAEFMTKGTATFANRRTSSDAQQNLRKSPNASAPTTRLTSRSISEPLAVATASRSVVSSKIRCANFLRSVVAHP